MSLKPPKKSDLKKPWMNKPDRTIKIRPEYHLIVTEGTGTEPAYFGAIQEIINKEYPEKIQLKVFGIGDNTINLFEKAKRLAKWNQSYWMNWKVNHSLLCLWTEIMKTLTDFINIL